MKALWRCICVSLHRNTLEILCSSSSPCPSVLCMFHLHLSLACFWFHVPPAGSHSKTCIHVSLAHLCRIHSGWFSPVSELTCEPPLCGRISQNARFGGCVHWAPHYVGRGDSREEDRFLGATSLLAVLHSIFLADTFVFFLSSHSRLHCSITMNETIVLNTNVAFKSRLVPQRYSPDLNCF